MGIFPLCALFPQRRGEETFSGPRVKSIYPAGPHVSRICKYLVRRGRQHLHRSFSAFYEPPHGAQLEVSVAGYVGRPGRFTAGWHRVGKTAGREGAARRHQQLPALNPTACSIQETDPGPLVLKIANATL